MHELINRVNTNDKIRTLQQASYEARNGHRNVVAGVQYDPSHHGIVQPHGGIITIHHTNGHRNGGMIEVPTAQNSPSGIVHSDRKNNYTNNPSTIYGDRIRVQDAPPGAPPPPPAPRPNYDRINTAPQNTQLPHHANIRVPTPTALPISREFRRSDFPIDSPPPPPPGARTANIQVGIVYPPDTSRSNQLRSPLIPTSLPAPPPPAPRPSILAPSYPTILPPPPINIELKRSGKMTFDERSQLLPANKDQNRINYEKSKSVDENQIPPTPKPSVRTVVYSRPSEPIQYAQHIFHPDPKKPEEINDQNNRIPVSTRGFTLFYPKPISYQYSHQVINLMPRRMGDDGSSEGRTDRSRHDDNNGVNQVHPNPADYERRVEGGDSNPEVNDGPEFSYTDIPTRNTDPEEETPNVNPNNNGYISNGNFGDRNGELNYVEPVTEANPYTRQNYSNEESDRSHANDGFDHDHNSGISITREDLEDDELYRSSTSPHTASPDFNHHPSTDSPNNQPINQYTSTEPNQIDNNEENINYYDNSTPVPSTTIYPPAYDLPLSTSTESPYRLNPVQEALAPYPTPDTGTREHLTPPPDLSHKVYDEIKRAEGDPGYTFDPSNLHLEGLRRKAHDEDSRIHGTSSGGFTEAMDSNTDDTTKINHDTYPFGDGALEIGDSDPDKKEEEGTASDGMVEWKAASS